jgi:CelD/BcsL family acetyltransferase involved in cellulose biosynthesis
MTRVRVVRSLPALEECVPGWRRLLERASHAQAVLTPLWTLAWWREFGERDGRALRAMAVEEGGELVGLLPLSRRLALHRGAIPVRRLELLGTGEREEDEIGSDYVGGLVARGYEARAARAVADAIRGGALGEWDELRLASMSADDPWVARLGEALGACGITASIVAGAECPYIPLPGTWDAYLEALGSERRYVVTRSLRELDKWAGAAGWELRLAGSADELAEGKEALKRLHAERWSAKGRSGVFASARFERFHDGVMPRLLAGEDGASLELLWLVVRGEPVAAAYYLLYGGRVQFYQSGRRLDVPKGFRPGIALHALAIRRSIRANRSEYDFLAGASRYKRHLALATRHLVQLRAVAPGLRARAVEATCLLAERAIERVRDVRTRSAASDQNPALD